MTDQNTAVTIAKIDKLPSNFYYETDAIDLWDRYPFSAHNEKQTELVCEEESGPLNDTFEVKGSRLGPVYEWQFKFDSEALAKLWNNGTVNVKFNRHDGTWSMSGSAKKRWWYKRKSEWKFCSPETVIDKLIAIIECSFLTQETSATLDLLKANRNAIINSATLYTERRDCKIQLYSDDLKAYPGGPGAEALD